MNEFDDETQDDNYNTGEDDLEDCNNLIEEGTGDPEVDSSTWTENALDSLISLMTDLKKANRLGTFASKKKLFQFVEGKLAEKRFKFTADQIEGKWDLLKDVYLRKKARNIPVEAELENLFDESLDSKIGSAKRSRFVNDDEDYVDDASRSSKCEWNETNTKLLLALLREVKPKVGNSENFRSKRKMWEYVSAQMLAQGHRFTATQIENKWKGLVRTYRKRLERSKPVKPEVKKIRLEPQQTAPDAWAQSFEENIQSNTSHPVENDSEIIYEHQQEDVSQDYVEEAADPDNYIEEEESKATILEGGTTIETQFVPQYVETTAVPGYDLSALNNFAKEFSEWKQHDVKLRTEELRMRRIEMENYKERTKEISKAVNMFSNFMDYFKRRENF